MGRVLAGLTVMKVLSWNLCSSSSSVPYNGQDGLLSNVTIKYRLNEGAGTLDIVAFCG